MRHIHRGQRRHLPAITAAALATVLLLAPLAWSQQVNVATPFNTVGSSYYEQFGTQWGLRGNGWFARFGGPVAPPFGGFDPSAGASFGFGGRNGFLNFSAAQGSSTTFGSQTPMLTLPNGGTGFFADQSLRPFVTGIIPVVGDGPPVSPFGSVLDERLSRLSAGQPATSASSAPAADAATPASALPSAAASGSGPSTAERGDLSIAEIESSRAEAQAAAEAAEQAKIDELVASGDAALAAGKVAAARIYWQQAARRAAGEQRAQILKRIDSAR